MMRFHKDSYLSCAQILMESLYRKKADTRQVRPICTERIEYTLRTKAEYSRGFGASDISHGNYLVVHRKPLTHPHGDISVLKRDTELASEPTSDDCQYFKGTKKCNVPIVTHKSSGTSSSYLGGKPEEPPATAP